MEFAKEFPAPSSTRVMLADNYRSHQHIIDAAEHIVKSAPAISGKKARACGPAAETPLPVKVLERDEASLAETLLEHYRNGESVMLLYRKSSDKAAIADHLQALVNHEAGLPAAQRRLRQLTYHSAKGLQADAVFMLGDCQHLTNSPYKNQVYRQAGLGRNGDAQAFDNAQKDEVLRLAYVAITRAAKHCYWYVEKPTAEAANLPRASSQVDGRKVFFEDGREMASS
ncbi:DNA helicase IV [compost metagenome]